MKKDFGLIHVYCGDGKGKTTAAFGMALRAAGHGKKVRILQFLKNAQCGEVRAVRALPNIEVYTANVNKFVYTMSEEECAKTRDGQCCLLQDKGCCCADMLILDEVFGAIETGMLDQEMVLKLIKKKPSSQELILTGRTAPNEIAAIADYLCVVESKKHPYTRGVQARDGIEK